MTLLSTLKCLFKKDVKPTGVVYSMWEHNTWANSIMFQDFEKRTIYGHYSKAGLLYAKPPYRLQVGDELRCQMQSKQIARFLITEIKYCNDPPDMFFGQVKDLGYLER